MSAVLQFTDPALAAAVCKRLNAADSKYPYCVEYLPDGTFYVDVADTAGVDTQLGATRISWKENLRPLPYPTRGAPTLTKAHKDAQADVAADWTAKTGKVAPFDASVAAVAAVSVDPVKPDVG